MALAKGLLDGLVRDGWSVPTTTPRDFFGNPDTSVVKKRKPRPAAVKVECLECSKKFSVSGNRATDPVCPKCGGVDIDVRF